MCIYISVYVRFYAYICMHEHISVGLIHDSQSANCVLPAMHKVEAYIGSSLLLPTFRLNM